MTVLDRLRAADPATDHAPPADEQLLERLVAEPRTPQSRRRGRPVRRLAAIGAVATAALAAVALVSGDGPSPDLAARAYAQTSAAEQILYARTSSVATRDGDSFAYTTEHWTYNGRGLLRTTTGEDVHELKIAADGRVSVRQGSAADWRTLPAGAGVDQLQRGFVEQFRRDYEAGELDPAGAATFAGHDAQRYRVTDARGIRSEYYLDAKTAEPLGEAHAFRGSRVVTTVQELSHLAPTPENLAKLT